MTSCGGACSPATSRSPRTRPFRRTRSASRRQLERLLYLAHRDKRTAFQEFSEFYLASSGQVYWNDTHQLNLYLEDYHEALDARLGAPCRRAK